MSYNKEIFYLKAQKLKRNKEYIDYCFSITLDDLLDECLSSQEPDDYDGFYTNFQSFKRECSVDIYKYRLHKDHNIGEWNNKLYKSY